MHADQIIWISDCCGSTELGEANHRYGISSPEEFDNICLSCHKICEPIPLSCEFCKEFIQEGGQGLGFCCYYVRIMHKDNGVENDGNPCEHFELKPA